MAAHKPGSHLLQFFLTALFIHGFLKSYSQNPEKFFPAKELMPIGSYYYPEQWPRKYWARDIKKMADVGFDFTHFGEFLPRPS